MKGFALGYGREILVRAEAECAEKARGRGPQCRRRTTTTVVRHRTRRQHRASAGRLARLRRCPVAAGRLHALRQHPRGSGLARFSEARSPLADSVEPSPPPRGRRPVRLRAARAHLWSHSDPQQSLGAAATPGRHGMPYPRMQLEEAQNLRQDRARCVSPAKSVVGHWPGATTAPQAWGGRSGHLILKKLGSSRDTRVQ